MIDIPTCVSVPTTTIANMNLNTQRKKKMHPNHLNHFF